MNARRTAEKGIKERERYWAIEAKRILEELDEELEEETERRKESAKEIELANEWWTRVRRPRL